MPLLTRDRRNVLVLAICQMLFNSGRSLIVATAPLIAYGIAADKSLATLPHALVIVGTALLTFPASLLMRRLGRRAGFVVGAVIGAAGAAVCVVAVSQSHFWAFCLGTLLFGTASGFAQHYRFAATDVAAPEFRAKAVSLVLAGGVAAAILGPELAKLGKDLFASTEFLGGYVFLIGLTLSTALAVMLLDIPPLTPAEKAEPGRPLSVIMRQPVFIVAVTATTVAQGSMNLLMTATPIAMHKAHHLFGDIALVIEWHSVLMFAPGFFTGSLVKRWGELPMILAGLVIITLSVFIALAGDTVFLFWASMSLLGFGWNFAFTASTSMLIGAHTPSERAKTQGVVNSIVYGTAAVAALSAGSLLHNVGWAGVGWVPLPFLAVALAVVIHHGWGSGPAPSDRKTL
ncbi:MAG: MFS transporter [Alphaproteobacteria bacterium]